VNITQIGLSDLQFLFQCADAYRVFGHFERDLDVALRAEVVDLGGLDLGDDVDEVSAVGEIAVVEMELVGALVLVLDTRKRSDNQRRVDRRSEE
jgi:hypothetical protein